MVPATGRKRDKQCRKYLACHRDWAGEASAPKASPCLVPLRRRSTSSSFFPNSFRCCHCSRSRSWATVIAWRTARPAKKDVDAAADANADADGLAQRGCSIRAQTFSAAALKGCGSNGCLDPCCVFLLEIQFARCDLMEPFAGAVRRVTRPIKDVESLFQS